MDLRKPLAAPLRAAFLNPPLFLVVVVGLRLEGLGGMGGLTPEGPGVAGYFFILAGVTGSGLIFALGWISCFSSDSKGASTRASSGSGAPTPSGGMPPVRILLVSRT